MICPKDLVQMHQYNAIGGGEATDEMYATWTVQVCPTCGRLVREGYTCEVITKEKAEELAKEVGISVSGLCQCGKVTCHFCKGSN